MSAALIWCSFEDEESAAKAASQLLDEYLIACANLIGEVRSLYVWQGERGEARECGALMKTDASLLERAVERLAEIHPYESPAIAGWHADATAAATAAWLKELVR